jgi:uncharacterized protein GlcG (DUF336 family)
MTEVVTTDTFLSKAQRAVDAGLAWAREHEARMTVLVMDATGTVCSAARMDGSRTITYEIALAKANTAREFGTSTADLARNVKPENKIAIGQVARRIAFLGGGLPIANEDGLLGAVAASGGTEDQDIECAAVALQAFSA